MPSGYGVEQRDMLFRFLKDGWPTAQIAFSGLEGAMIGINGLQIYPKMGDTWGSDAMLYHSRHFNAHVVFTMQDVWTLQPQILQQLRWIPYVPIDQDPIPPNVLQNLRFAYKIITFAKWGQKVLMKHGFTSTLIPEGTDIEIFKPMDKAECRRLFNIPQDKFVVGMIGANKENPPRKGWQEALEAFAMFHLKHPKSIFFFQTNQNSPGGFPIQPFAEHLGIGKALMTIDPYLGTFHAGSDVMAKLMNCFDIQSHASLTEGFGLCIIEAQACGIPIVVNNACTMPELIIEGETGEICSVGKKYFTNAGGYYHIPDPNSLYQKYEKLYRADRKKMSLRAREHIEKNYNIDTIVEKQWIPYLESLQDELLGKIDNNVKTG